MQRFILAGAVLVALSAAVHPQEGAAPPKPLDAAQGKLPVKEITVFKDGHSLVLREGAMPTDAAGHVVLDGLPIPVIGTFWPYSAEAGAKLGSVVAGRADTRVEKKAVILAEFLEANTGAQVYITCHSKEVFTGTILGIPRRPADPAGPVPADLSQAPTLLLKTLEGMRTVPIASIEHVTFKDKSETKYSEQESRAALTLRLDWGAAAPPKTARVGMMYVQKGVRWIPGYRIELDGKGKALVRLQATLVNELIDLEDVTVHLVIGVPSFTFKDTPDPIALQRDMAQLSRYFQPESQMAYAMSNAIMSQSARMGEQRVAAEPAGDRDPRIPEDGAKEDFFVFPVKKISLKKGECMVVQVAEFTVETKDVYTLDLPMTPPRDLRAEMGGSHQAEMARLLHAPKVMHKIRLSNSGTAPLTTAPALILTNGQVLAQGMMTYTSPGGTTDVDVTAAVDVQVRKSETETSRTPNALRWRNDNYQRIDLEGKINLTNYRSGAVEVEVRRRVLGEVAPVGPGGRVEKINQMEDAKEAADYSWWSYGYGWWSEVNSVSRVTWKVSLEPGKSAELPYTWHYFWR
jgi:hypothetical protein